MLSLHLKPCQEILLFKHTSHSTVCDMKTGVVLISADVYFFLFNVLSFSVSMIRDKEPKKSGKWRIIVDEGLMKIDSFPHFFHGDYCVPQVMQAVME